jgi:hypothetical protein
MAQLVITAGQSAVSALQAVGPALANAAVNTAMAALTGRRREGPRLPEIQVQTSTDGAPMARVWGRARIAGQVIWASRYSEHATKTSSGGKGGPSQVDYTYSISFAVGLCEGEIAGVGRVWANGALLDTSKFAMRVHTGSDAQMPDALIEALEGSGAPAFRGTAYIVFEDLPLDEFGHRIPNLSFEIFRPHRDGVQLEDRVRGVNLIPGSGEFAYAPEPVMRVLGPGREQAENCNNARGVSDFIAALDDLERDLPACRSVQLVVSWFGDDLRCGECSIRPGVETRDKQTRPAEWRVAGEDRASAYLISGEAGRPVFGGTPDDASVIAAIGELNARGFSVTLYPFILMDVPAGNGLADPWGGAEQAVFPWRGRITCHPAPGEAGSVDGTAAAESQVASFFGAAAASDSTVSGTSISYSGPAEWGFNRFILHCAALAKAAGGVDAFLIGSEMVSLTTIRGAGGSYPAVAQLQTLAGEVRALLGSGTALSYAADWTEYSGHQPGGGARIFHLDPLWSDAAIDAVAIDWYVPLSDWRDGVDHLDLGVASGPHDRAYLAANMTAGEGYDWYSASEADRLAQVRTPITDGAYGEAWVWRYKDLVSWWSQPHHDRPGGVRSGTPTDWVPQSKPVWLTEVGCPAVDRGGNQPNVFVDPKSSESHLPWFSGGTRDDLVQRRYLEAMLGHWTTGEAANPVSSLYGEPMVASDRVHVWAWDARPWPDFPARSDVWSDGANWTLGHWLNGRAGLVPVAEIIAEICQGAGFAEFETGDVDDLVSGYVLGEAMPARAALEPLIEVLGLDALPRASALHFASAAMVVSAWPLAECARTDGPALVHTDPSGFDRPREVSLDFLDDTAEYRPGRATACGLFDSVEAVNRAAPILADPDLARSWCRDALAELDGRGAELALHLPPSALAVEAGDVVTLDDATWRVETLDGGTARPAGLRPPRLRNPGLSGASGAVARPAWQPPARPVFLALDLPLDGRGAEARGGLLAAGFASPWPGALDVYVGVGGGEWQARVRLARPAMIGVLLEEFPAGPTGYWDRAASLLIELGGGELSSVSPEAVLNGANRLAIGQPDGGWEVVQFANAELAGERRYRLSGFLRGLGGTDAANGALSGAACVVLDTALEVLPLEAHETGAELTLRCLAAGLAASDTQAAQILSAYEQVDLRPLAPVHLRLRRAGGLGTVSWIRCTRMGGDDWRAPDVPLGEAREAYRVQVLAGGNVLAEAETGTPVWTISESELTALIAGLPEPAELHIAQISDRVGPGRIARMSLAL